MLSLILICVIAFALLFEFINGFHDTANAIATSVYTHALKPRQAIALAAVMNFIGALVSEKVALTISRGLVNTELELYVIMAALLGAITWNLITWWIGIPSSSSHALIGSLVGATLIYTMSLENIIWSGVLKKVIIPLFTSPLIGFVVGYFLMNIVFQICANYSFGKVSRVFQRLQIISAAFVAYSHGNNDAQKTMGIITMALVGAGFANPAEGVPLWVKLACAFMMALGTSVGGWRIMRTMGRGVTRLEPSNGFVSQTASAIVIELASLVGAPVSTTQVITTSIMGTGFARRASAVNWGVGKDIVGAWFLTLPAAMLLGAMYEFVLRFFF